MRNTIAEISRFFTGLRFRLLLLLVMVCTPLVAFTLHTASQERRSALTRWRQRAQTLAQAAYRDETNLVWEVTNFVAGISISDRLEKGQTACQELANEQRDRKSFAAVGILDSRGEVMAYAGTNVAHREVFREMFKTNSQRLRRSPFQATKLVLAGGAVHYGQRVKSNSGETVAVVFAAYDLNRRTNLTRFWRNPSPTIQLGASLVQVALDSRLVLGSFVQTNVSTAPRGADRTADTNLHARIRVLLDSPPAAGQALADTNLLKKVFATVPNQSGVFEAPNAKGTKMVYAYSPARSMFANPTATILAIPKDSLFADADEALKQNLSWLAGAMAVALLAGWVGSSLLILRPVRVVINTSSRVATGDLAARTGLNYPRDELGQLARAFDVMASTLEKRELERRLDNKKLQVLSQRLVEVQESERRQIARELHDEVGQSLTAAEINLQAALAAENPPATQSRLRASSEMLQHVLEQVQDLSLNLRPSMLDDLGLESALRWYTGRQAETSGIEAEFVSDPLEQRLDPVIETECFRVAQEALTNVLRHSKASSVTVELRADDSTLRLSVRDDGVGFDVAAVRDQAVRGGSLGVLSMEERVTIAGGKLELVSVAGQGTDVRASFPLRWRDQN